MQANTAPVEVDTLVIGGGSAGAAVAGRLAERSAESVLLLEAGPDYGPLAAGAWPEDLLDARALALSHDWAYSSGGTYVDRVVPFERARVIGGCSSHNGCAAIWGHRLDYDGWAAAGNDGWSADDLLPFFRAADDRMRVRTYRAEEATPFHAACLAAARAIGIPMAADLNDLDDSVGMALSPSNISKGWRWNSAFAYLDPVRDRPNLRIMGEVLVDRLLLDGDRVTGARAIGPDRAPVEVRAERTILCAGTYGSPAILLRSGIGSASALAQAGVEPRHELNGVGENLHDHPSANLAYAGSPALISQMEAFAASHWMPEEQTIAKLRSRGCAEAFDLHVFPVGGPWPDNPSEWRFEFPVACMTPAARGWLRLPNADPNATPLIDHQYLGDVAHRDCSVIADGFEVVRAMAAQEPLRSLLGPEIVPGPAIASREAIEAYIDHTVVHYYHPVGTCAMGPASDPRAVVDPRGRIHGLSGGYIADCSIIPVIPRANTNIPAVVIGERIASFLLGA